MRIRTRKNLRKKNAVISVFFMLPLIGFGGYLGACLYIIEDVASFTFNLTPPDTSYFTPLDEINTTYLEQMAHYYDDQMERYHMKGTNISVNIEFKNSSYNEVEEWKGTDNGALALGYALASQCFRYKVALMEGNQAELDNATRMVKKMVYGFSNMLAAPNGGIGPDYPGTPARFVCSPESREYHPWMFDEHPRHFNGTGAYSKWRVRLYTSRDELAGYYIGLACVLKFIDPTNNTDSEWCVERVKLLVAQLIEGFKKTNWLVVGGNGEPVGSDLNPQLEGSMWQLTLMRLGATAYPQRYDSLYHHVASKFLELNFAKMGSIWNTVSEYYALTFSMTVEYSLIILEDNPQLKHYYIKNFENGFYSYVRYHRNAYYNLIHLAFMTMVSDSSVYEDPDYTDTTIRHDILDQLWRFKTNGWTEGIRNYNISIRPNSTRSTSNNTEIAKKNDVSSIDKWNDFFDNHAFGSLFSWLGEQFDYDEPLYTLPITVSEYKLDRFLWEHNKFRGEGGTPEGNGLEQATPASYLIVYWLARFYDVI